MNGAHTTTAFRDADGGHKSHDTVTATSQFKLKKGDTVRPYFGGYFYYPIYSYNAYFEGHLIRQIEE